MSMEAVRRVSSQDAAGHTDYRELSQRLGSDLLRKRIAAQAGIWARKSHQGKGIFRIERILPVNAIVRSVLWLCCVEELGRRNCLDIEVIERDVILPDLPRAFEGFRLLHLSDLHCDLQPELIDVLTELLGEVQYDAVVITGDYHNRIGDEFDISLDLMARLIRVLSGPRYGSLGNHDFIEKVAFLEAAGLPILLNEAVPLEKDGERIWFCGIDDPNFFRTHDLHKARAGVSAGETTILLSHSPEPYRDAAEAGYSFMLCGHTHGGQICLPGGRVILHNYAGPRWLASGGWSCGRMQGYTSRGTGSCGVAARYFCPPEIAIHTLRRS
jgi:predicted MPP superfamily phosphohydrolase